MTLRLSEIGILLALLSSGCAQCTDVWITSPNAGEAPQIDISQLPRSWGVELRNWTENGLVRRHIYKVALPANNAVRIVLVPSTQPTTRPSRSVVLPRCDG